jgi:hypothetical protein
MSAPGLDAQPCDAHSWRPAGTRELPTESAATVAGGPLWASGKNVLYRTAGGRQYSSQFVKNLGMPPSNEPKVLLAGPALAADRPLRKRLSGDYILQTAETMERGGAAMESGDIDLVVSEQQYTDGRGVDFLQRMRVVHPNSLRILVVASARREEIVKAINDAAISEVEPRRERRRRGVKRWLI